MPFKIIVLKGGYKVQNKDTKKTYSNKPMTLNKAQKQLIALKIHTKH